MTGIVGALFVICVAAVVIFVVALTLAYIVDWMIG